MVNENWVRIELIGGPLDGATVEMINTCLKFTVGNHLYLVDPRDRYKYRYVPPKPKAKRNV